MRVVACCAMLAFVLLACEGPEGEQGPMGPSGAVGPAGPPGQSADVGEVVAAVLDSLHSLPESTRPIEELPYVFEGRGTQATSQFVLVANTLYVLHAEFELDSFLIVHVIDGDTGDTEVFALNESSGTTSVSAPFNVDHTGNYLLEVDNVRGNWAITIAKE